ncbi:hypothetical protein AAY473_008347 [Plecturocebus cupreus]
MSLDCGQLQHSHGIRRMDSGLEAQALWEAKAGESSESGGSRCSLEMQNDTGEFMDLYVPWKWSNRNCITDAKDHQWIQMDEAYIDEVEDRLEHNGAISGHRNLCLLGSSDSPTSASQDYRHAPPCLANFVFLVETGFLHVDQAGLKLLTSGDPPTSASQSAGITGMSHHSLLLLRRLGQENRLNLGGRGCSELRLCHCTPAWATEPDSVSRKKKN